MALLGLVRLLGHWELGSFRQAVEYLWETGLPVRMWSMRTIDAVDHLWPSRAPVRIQSAEVYATASRNWRKPPCLPTSPRWNHPSWSPAVPPSTTSDASTFASGASFRRVAGFESEVLVLGALAPDGEISLLTVDAGAEPGQRVA